MPAVPAGSKVLVTGASAYIGVHTVSQLLDAGYKVLGTVRSQSKGEYLRKKFSGKDFDFVVVEDVEKENGFDECVQDVDAIEHLASPFHFKWEDPIKELVNPAVNGTLSVLRAAHKNGKNVKRIVITSSFASVLDSSAKPVVTFTEKDWNTNSPKILEEKGRNCPPPEAYRASKVKAERAAWEFVDKEKPQFDIVTIMPPLVFGPVSQQVDSPESLNTSVAQWWAYLNGEKSADGADGPAGNFVDVREVAQAHVEAIKQEEAGGNRFAITTAPFTWQQALDVFHEDGKDLQKTFSKVPKGKPGSGDNTKQNIYDGTKSKQVLGMKYRSLSDTIYDMSESLAKYQAGGWKGV